MKSFNVFTKVPIHSVSKFEIKGFKISEVRGIRVEGTLELNKIAGQLPKDNVLKKFLGIIRRAYNHYFISVRKGNGDYIRANLTSSEDVKFNEKNSVIIYETSKLCDNNYSRKNKIQNVTAEEDSPVFGVPNSPYVKKIESVSVTQYLQKLENIENTVVCTMDNRDICELNLTETYLKDLIVKK